MQQRPERMQVIADNITGAFGEGWFLNLPVMWSVDVQTELGMAIRHARDFGAALKIVAQYAPVRWPLAYAELQQLPTGAKLQFSPSVDFSASGWALIASLAILNFQTLAQGILGEDASRLCYHFPANRPPYAERLESLVTGSIVYGSPMLEITVPAELLDRSCVLADDLALAAMLEAMDERLGQSRMPVTVSARLSRLLTDAKHGRMAIDEAARKLGLSHRTLERRLAEEGTNFRVMTDQSLRTRFLQALRQPVVKADQVAEQLGYHDASSLQRACRRWFGKSYRAVRLDQMAKGKAD